MSSNLETDTEIQSLSCANITDNCNDSLHKLYEEQCLLSIPKDEVTRIQHAVEIMVRFLLSSIYENTSFSELVGSDKSIKRTLASFSTPPNIPYAFDDNNLLKVGSFYENTKNHYPDEFDFICVIAECRESEYVVMKTFLSSMADIFHESLKKAVSKPFLAGTCIKFVRYVRLHGPAAKLEYCYESAKGNKRSIFVDISPASRVFTQNNIPSTLHPEWKKLVQATGSFLLLKTFSTGHPKHETEVKISITESEQQYISEEMSENHKQVYRLLKYLLSNGSKGENLRELMRSEDNQTSVVCCRVFYPRVVYDFPSYVIKTLMFHHCLHCNNSSETISGCVVSVLDNILKQFKSEQRKKVKSRCLCGIQRSFSVSVETMSGEMIEVADSYDSSLKIKKYLKEIRDDILKDHVTGQIPLAMKMVPVVQKHRKKRENRKKCVRSYTKRCVFCVWLMCMFSVVIGVGIVADRHVQMRMCWNGTDYKGYKNYTSSVHFKRSNLSGMSTFDQGKSTSTTAIGNMYCLEYNNIGVHKDQANITMANVSRIYYCGDRSFCNTEDKLYQIKVFIRGIEEQLVCSALDIESRMENDYLLSDMINNENGMENTGRHLACLQKESACLNIKVRHFLFGRLFSEKAAGCDKHQPCMQTFSKQIVHMGCYMSQHINEVKEVTETEICCCDRRACTDPEKDEEEILAGNILAFSALVAIVAIMLLCLCCCCCLDARLAYCKHFIKRKNGKYRMS